MAGPRRAGQTQLPVLFIQGRRHIQVLFQLVFMQKYCKQRYDIIETEAVVKVAEKQLGQRLLLRTSIGATKTKTFVNLAAGGFLTQQRWRLEAAPRAQLWNVLLLLLLGRAASPWRPRPWCLGCKPYQTGPFSSSLRWAMQSGSPSPLGASGLFYFWVQHLLIKVPVKTSGSTQTQSTWAKPRCRGDPAGRRPGLGSEQASSSSQILSKSNSHCCGP